ncbi:hypothetical protein F5B17DRAFT_135011 [Nemania serpens]|nr:hypothetical protein F5B17DRAFT_135011 [Nemania serpens]
MLDETISAQSADLVSTNSLSFPTDAIKTEPVLVAENEVMVSTEHKRLGDFGATLPSLRVPSSVESCIQTCRCQCHHRATLESSRWLTEILGTLVYSYVGAPFPIVRPCDVVGCIQPPSSSYQLTYHFPRWMLNRAFILTMAYGRLGALSGSCSINFPCAIPVYHEVWLLIRRHEVAVLRKLLRQRVVYVDDLSDDDGLSLLTIS